MQKIVHAYVVVGVCGVSLSVVAAALLQGASALLKQSLPEQRLQLFITAVQTCRQCETLNKVTCQWRLSMVMTLPSSYPNQNQIEQLK